MIAAQVHQPFRNKCAVKELNPPTAAQLIQKINSDIELRTEWANMLAHQLPALPELDSHLARLPGLLGVRRRSGSRHSGRHAPPQPCLVRVRRLSRQPGIQYWNVGASRWRQSDLPAQTG